MINNRTYLYLCIVFILIFMASCGGGGSKSLAPAVTTPPAATDTGGDENAAKPPSPSPYTEAPRTVTDTEYVLVKTGDTPEKFAPIAAKFGYEVEYKSGHWLKVRVPDGDIDYAITELRKEYHVFDVQPLRHYIMPREESAPVQDVRLASYLPFDTLYNDRAILPTGATAEGDITYSSYFAQRTYMAPMGFEGAWDVAWRDDILAVPVTIAVIDAGIWHDPDDEGVHVELQTARLDAASARIFGDGTPPDTADYFYELDVESAPYRTTGHRLAGLFLSVVNDPTRVDWSMQVGDPPQEAHFIASLTPITPFANVMIIKTGHIDGENWAFSDVELIESINHAVSNGANIILLGMWTPTESMPPVSAPLQDAITAARDGDVLVIAPAGMAQLDTEDPDVENWTWGVPGEVAGVTPAAGTGVISVMGTGFEQLDMDADPPPNPGYANSLIANIGDAWNEIAEFSYTGGTMAAVGWGTTWSGNFYNVGINVNTSPGGPGNVDVAYAAAYVAGAASIAYQALVNAAAPDPPPADIDTIIENLLLDEALTLPDSEKFLAAGRVAHVAANGGYDKYIESVDILEYPHTSLSGAANDQFGNRYLEVGQETQLAVGMTSNGGDYEIVVVWGDGTIYPEGATSPITEEDFEPYTPGDPLDHTYTVAGSYELTILAHEAVNDTYDELSFWVFVYNPLSANIQITNVLGGVGTNLLVEEAYQAVSNVSYEPVTGNDIECDWDFNWDGVAANFSDSDDPDFIADSENPIISYGADPGGGGVTNYLDIGPGDYTIGLRVTQTRRPTVYKQIDVSVTTE